MKGLLVKTTGEVAAVEYTGDDAGQLAWLQAAVGGYIEPMSLGDGWVGIANEEGLIFGLDINRLAMQLLAQLGWDQPVVGDVLFLGEDGPEFVDAPKSVYDAATRLVLSGAWLQWDDESGAQG